MQTRSSSKLISESSSNPISTNLKHHNRRRSKPRVKPFSIPIVMMADNCMMEEMLQAPTDAIVVPDILAETFEIRTGLLSLIQANQFHGLESNNPHDHIRSFNRIHQLFSLGMCRMMLLSLCSSHIRSREPLKSGTKKTTSVNLDMGRSHNVPTMDFQSCTNTFYNGLNEHKQDSLNATVGGNLLRKAPLDALIIIENKSKVCYSRNKPVAFKVSTTSSGNSSSMDARIDKLTDRILNLVETFNKKMTTLATVKAVEETCVIYGGARPYYDYIATDSNISSACATTGGIENKIHSLMQNQINSVKNKLKSDINELRNMMASYFQKDTASTSGSGSLLSNTIANPRGDLKGITTQSGVSYDRPPIPPPTSFLPKGVERVPEPIRTIPYPSRANKQKLHEKDDILALKFVEIFRNLHFKLSFADALLHMPNFALMFKSLLNNKLNCSAVILKKLPKKLGDPGKFLIPCVFFEFDECLALVDLDIYGEELTLAVDDEARTFNVGQTSKYSYIDAELINRIDVINVACEEYVRDVLGFFDNSKSGSPTPTLDHIISYSSRSFTPFERSDFILEEIDTFLQTPDELIILDDDYYDTEGDILCLEKLLNEDPFPNLPLVKTKDLKQVDATMTNSSIDEPPELEPKELTSDLEYAFLEGTDKLPVIISKELKDEEKSALLKVLKSHKRAIACKISDIKGIDPRFFTHKILMEDDFKLVV
nr:reverse transcriptase domain-containing protein [Tanacetum cinerariifolium]